MENAVGQIIILVFLKKQRGDYQDYYSLCQRGWISDIRYRTVGNADPGRFDKCISATKFAPKQLKCIPRSAGKPWDIS